MDRCGLILTVLLRGRRQHFAGVVAGALGDLGAAQHAGDLFQPGRLVQRLHAGVGGAVEGFFTDPQLPMGLGGDLG